MKSRIVAGVLTWIGAVAAVAAVASVVIGTAGREVAASPVLRRTRLVAPAVRVAPDVPSRITPSVTDRDIAVTPSPPMKDDVPATPTVVADPAPATAGPSSTVTPDPAATDPAPRVPGRPDAGSWRRRARHGGGAGQGARPTAPSGR